jgi:hypothetical protein
MKLQIIKIKEWKNTFLARKNYVFFIASLSTIYRRFGDRPEIAIFDGDGGNCNL